MRVMLDTNVLVSAVLLRSPQMLAIIRDVEANHELLLGSYVVGELREVAARKFPRKADVIDAFIDDLSYALVPTPPVREQQTLAIRDPKDAPVLAEAIYGRADVLVTGDKDFGGLEVRRPEIISPAQYAERYIDMHETHAPL